MSDLAIDVQGLKRVYHSAGQNVTALKDLDLQVEAGRFVAVKGRSGSGKTTLLNCLGGLDQPTAGSIKIYGREITGLTDQQLTEWRQQEVGFIFQSFGLLPALSAFENVELMLRIGRVPRRERKQRALECLALVGLSKWVDHRPYEMSGGQAQRVAIARAIANRPKIILADEATGELDTDTARQILRLFVDVVAAEKMTIFLATHDHLVDEYVDEVLQLQNGEIVASVAA